MYRVIPWITPFPSYIICSQAKHVKSSTQNRGGVEVFDLANCWTDHARQSCWNSQAMRPWSSCGSWRKRFWFSEENHEGFKLIEGLGLTDAGTKLSEDIDWNRQGAATTGQKNYDVSCLLSEDLGKRARRRRLCLVGLGCLISSSHLPRLVHSCLCRVSH